MSEITIKTKVGLFSGRESEKNNLVHGYYDNTCSRIHLISYFDKECGNIMCCIEPTTLGAFTGRYAYISQELADQLGRERCPITGYTEIIGGIGPGRATGGDLVKPVEASLTKCRVMYADGAFMACGHGLHEWMNGELEIIGGPV